MKLTGAVFGMLIVLSESVCGISITGYTAANNNRFSSGFPSSPNPNTSVNFVGADYDWSGVAWSTTTFLSGNWYKGFSMLSPKHFLSAQHFEYGSERTTGVRILDKNGTVRTESSSSSPSNLGYGISLTRFSNTNYDLAISELDGPIAPPGTFARYAVLDLHNSSASNTFSNYDSIGVLLYGRSSSTNGSPRVAESTIKDAGIVNSDANQTVFLTDRTEVRLESGDSGSRAFHGWTNPNGGACWV